MSYLSSKHGFLKKTGFPLSLFSLTRIDLILKYKENDINLWFPRRVWKEIDS
jgi:hypothetical protein